MIEVSALVGDIPSTTITLRTFGAATLNVYGETVRTPTDASVEAVVHPLSSRRTLERLGLDFTRETISVYTTNTPMPVTSRVLHAGRWYEVVSFADYVSSGVGDMYMAHAQLLDASAEGTV